MATSIPIIVPPGRGGVQPVVRLAYNSNSGNGVLGVGWGLELGSIQISTQRGLPHYNSKDTYILNLGGQSRELVYDSAAGFYRSRVEGTFAKTEKVQNHWVMTDRQGTKYHFGQTSASRMETSSQIFKWGLDRVEDVHGNYMTVEYVNDDGKTQGFIYPRRVRYTGYSGPAPLEPYATVEFNYESRPDTHLKI
jgi:hypothetical protein